MRKPFVLSMIVVSGLFAGCSADVMRFDNPFSNPFTSSTRRAPLESAKTYRPQPSYKATLPKDDDSDVVTNSTKRKMVEEVKQLPYNDNVSKAWQGQGAIKPAINLPRQMVDSSQLRGGWSPIGGTTITARAGQSVESLSKQYGVPASAIAQANGVSQGQSFSSGQAVVIPTYSINHKVGSANKPANASKQVSEKSGIVGLRTKTAAVNPKETISPKKQSSYSKYARSHVVNDGDSLLSIAHRYNVSGESLVKTNKLADSGKLKIGQTLVIPATSQMAAAKTTPAKPIAVAKATTKAKVDMTATGSIPKVKSPPKTTPVALKVEEPLKKDEPSTTRADLEFRWPVRAGRVISHFGQELNGAENEGVNIAVPEGTEIRAAEDGEVVYAGNGLKNYGNLLLIRHGEKYVTAYAHAKDLNVRLGDKVKRGQVIARAGQTGSVSSPQVHFEVRQGKQSIDPETKLSAM